MVLTDRWLAPAWRQRPTWSTSASAPPSVQVDPPFHPELPGVAAGAAGPLVDDGPGLVEPRSGNRLGKPAVGQAPDPAQGPLGCPAEPDRDRPLDRQRRQAGAGDPLRGTLVGHGPLGPQPAEELHLLLGTPAPIGEAAAEGLVLDGVPAQARRRAGSARR